MSNNPNLSQRAAVAVSDSRNQCFVSVISIWEVAVKFRSGRLPEAAPLVHDPKRILSTLNFKTLPLELEHARFAGSLVNPHKDPFDRMLAAQAILEGLTLVSKDAVFDTMLVTRLW